MKAGGAYLPIDVSYPSERRALLLREAQAPLAIMSEGRDPRIAGVRSVLLHLEAAAIAANPDTAPEVQVSPDDLAYVIFTSGSTGKPKGVEVTHRALINLIDWHCRAFALTSTDRTSQVSGLAFDAAVWEIWPVLTVGGSLHFCSDEARLSPELLQDWLVSQEISVSFAPTVLAHELIGMEYPLSTRLRFLLTGADTLTRFPPPGLPFRLVNNYGPTEFAVVATSGVVGPSTNCSGLPSIGRPIDNTRIYILDANLEPVSHGETGELFLSGPSLARGYRLRPDLTAARFLPNPFSGIAGDRMYRTGDIVKLLDDGQIAFLGRADDQIKIRGFRIEPGEVSSVLDTHEGVRVSTVVAVEAANGDKRLVAYIVAKGAQSPSAADLRSHLERQLPEWMIPSVFVPLKELPLTANGKLDRAALPHPDVVRDLSTTADDSAETLIQKSIAAIVCGVLGFDDVGVDENFFAIGGHSLMGAQVIARIRDTFGVQLSLRDLFIAPTISTLANRTEELLLEQLDSISDAEAATAPGLTAISGETRGA
jgi:amino acid adenylation domain-containing protein